MLDELAFLIKGYDGVSDSRRKFVWLCRMFEVCREKPIRIRGKRVSSEFLHTHLRIRLCHLGLEDRKTVIENVLGSLREYDEQLYYFVLVATYRLSDDCLFESLHEYLMREWQVSVLIDGACEFVLLYDRAKVPKLLDFFDQGDAQFSHDFPSICGEGAACPPIPRLPWDITPALNTHLAVPDVNKEDPIEPTDICPLDCRGLITPQYSELLASDELRLVAADTRPGNFCEILFFDREASASALLNLFDGVSSDLFQEKNGVFYLARNCKIGAWSIALSKVVMTPLLEMANRITSTWRAISGSIDSSANGGKLRQVIISAIEEVNCMLRVRLSQILKDYVRDQKFIEGFTSTIESHTVFLSLCQQVLDTSNIEVVPLVFTLRCVRDSSLCPHARSACETVLRAVIRLAAMSVCVFVNSGRCDFKDRVFVEAVLSKVSPDRNGYGEIWESNFGVALPSSPEFSSRLCREVVKQGVLVRLLRTDIATVSGEVVDLLELYKLDDSQLAVDLDAELLKVSTHVEEVLAVSGEISVPTLENLVHWIVSSSAMFKICSHVAAAILRDVRSMCDVIRHLLLCAGSIDSEFEVCNRTTVYKLRAELEAQRFDRRHISAVDVHIGCTEARLVISPPEPLSIIITPGHARRYVRIYTFLADLTRAGSALEKVDLREPRIGVNGRRMLFYCCCSMLRLVAGIRDHVLTEVDAVWQMFREDLEKVKTIDHAIDAHRRAMKIMMQRTLLDVSHLTTGRTLGVMCESCIRFAQAMNAGDEASAFIHHRTFDEHSQLLREKLSVERTNVSARMLLWRMGSREDPFEEENAIPSEVPTRSQISDLGS